MSRELMVLCVNFTACTFTLHLPEDIYCGGLKETQVSEFARYQIEENITVLLACGYDPAWGDCSREEPFCRCPTTSLKTNLGQREWQDSGSREDLSWLTARFCCRKCTKVSQSCLRLGCTKDFHGQPRPSRTTVQRYRT